MRTLFYRLPRLTVLFLLVAFAGGAGAILGLGRQEDPTLIERFGYVLVTLPGADAQRMEALVTEPLENALQELDELAELDSAATTLQARARARLARRDVASRRDKRAAEQAQDGSCEAEGGGA